VAIPQILTNICKFLIEQDVIFSTWLEDGRINASINEPKVLDAIKRGFDIHIPRSRNWFDFSIEDAGKFYPINIKITDATHADNLNCKLGIYYALTGVMPDFPNEINWLAYFEKLSQNMGINCQEDYYFIVINKQNPTDIFVNSLKGLDSLQANGNNLPFQCHWQRNRSYRLRSFQEA
jgi:hypothetical protein